MAIDIEKQRHRQRHIECWQASGLTRTAYCARAGIALSTFDYWRRQAQESLRDKASVTWVSAQVEGGSGMGADGGILLHSPGGWRVTLPAHMGMDAIAHLLARLP